ncbi:MAG: hypothetical protein ACK5B9_05360 [Flavobacteriia bacterium]|jgi:hypothetical protein
MNNAIFNFKVGQGPNVSDMVRDLTTQKDFYDFLLENNEKTLKVEFSAKISKSDKQEMYDFYHKVVLSVAIQVFTNEGWDAMDKVKADHFLKMECAKGLVFNHKLDRTEIFIEEKSKMNKQRLHKFISDCIVFLEVEKGARVPDADSYKIDKLTGLSGFTKIK